MNKTCFNTFPVLESDRLILREIALEDTKSILSIYGDPVVAEYEWFKPLESEEKAIKLIKHFKQEFDDKVEITWGITLKSNDEVIGYCCLGDFDEDAERCEIGYGLRQSAWKKGIATEAVKMATEFGFESMDLNRIEAVVTLGNDASVKVLKKAGFVQEGIMRERSMMKDKLVDDVMLAILRRDFAARKVWHRLLVK